MNDIDELIQSMENHSWGSVERIESRDIPIHNDYAFEIK